VLVAERGACPEGDLPEPDAGGRPPRRAAGVVGRDLERPGRRREVRAPDLRPEAERRGAGEAERLERQVGRHAGQRDARRDRDVGAALDPDPLELALDDGDAAADAALGQVEHRPAAPGLRGAAYDALMLRRPHPAPAHAALQGARGQALVVVDERGVEPVLDAGAVDAPRPGPVGEGEVDARHLEDAGDLDLRQGDAAALQDAVADVERDR
jgi:hypothetical protein